MKSERLSSTSVRKECFLEMIHEYFMETLGKESPSYSTGKNGQQSLRGGERALKMMDWSGCQKVATADENVKVVHTLAMCYRRRDLQSIASELGIISFWAVQSILTNILGISKVWQDGCREY